RWRGWRASPGGHWRVRHPCRPEDRRSWTWKETSETSSPMLGVRGYHGVAGIARGTPCKGEISLCAGMHYADAMNETSRPLDERLVILAEIGAAHGIAGEVRIRSHTADPLAFGRYGPLSGSDGRSYRVLSMRPSR